MSRPPREGDSIVSRLTVRASGVDPLTTRLRAEAQLSGLDLRPAGLPPAAVLCVRRVRDPRPGTLALRAGARPPAEWQQAVRAACDAAARRAARPAREDVSDDAEAVLFADRSEWLACLALDWLSGRLAARWWWRAAGVGPGDGAAAPAGRDAARRVAAAWCAAPEAVPAALSHLAARGRAVAFVESLEEPEAAELVRTLTRTFGLTALYAELERPVAPGQPASVRSEPAAAWTAIVPEAAAGATEGPRRSLLVLALTLHRTPARARTPAFARAVSRLASGSLPTPPPADEPRTARVEGAVVRPAPPADEAPPHAAEEPPRSRPERPSQPPTPDRAPPDTHVPTSLTRPLPPGAPPPAPRTPSRASPPPIGPDAPTGAASHAEWPRPAADRDALASPAADGEPSAPESRPACPGGSGAFDEVAPDEPAEVVETGLGGVFFLINVGLALGLYADFTRPLAPGLALPVWDLLALLGTALLGDEVRDDPAWPLLGWLSGRAEGEEPGVTFEPPDDWSIPTAWLRPFPEAGTWTWSAAAGRLRVWHHAGFPVADQPLGPEDLEEQVTAATDAYRPMADFVLVRGERPEMNAGDRPLGCWVARLAAYVGPRLARAVGESDGASAAALVFRLRARLLLTSTRLDVVMSLDELPIEVRRAGLDRDPGWLPAAGRYVAFHFE